MKKAVLVIRSFRLPLVLAAALAAAATVASPASAAAKKPPAATPSPTAAPAAAPSPTAAPEALDKAIPRLEAKLKADPNDKAAMTELAQDYYSANRPDLALALAAKLIAAGQKTAQTYYLQGISNAALGKRKEAIDALQNASNLEPTNAAVLGALTSLYLQDNRAADAERVAKRAITFNKDDKDANITYGQVLANEQKYDEARTQFEVAAKLDPKDARPIVLEAGTYVRQNALALAAQVYDRALTVDPNNQEALAGKATLLANEHNVKDAGATYEKLLALQTNDQDKASIVDQIAHMYAVEKMNGEAEATYKRAINDYPKVPNTHLQYGDFLAFSKDMAGAEREWTTAAGPNRDYPDALGRLGEYYASKNQLGKAIDNYKRLTEVASQDPKAYLLLGQAYGVNKQYDKAREAFKQSYSLSHTPESLFGLAQADYQSRNYRECADIYSTVDRTAPQITKQNPQLLFLLGQCYQKGGDSRKARDAYARFLPYLKPGSQAQREVRQIIADIDRSAKPKPAAKPSPKATQTSQKK